MGASGGLLFAGTIVLVMSLVFGGVGIAVGRRERRFAAVAETADGTLVDYERQVRTRRRNGRRRTYEVFLPLLRFTLPDGRVVDTRSAQGTNRRPTPPGSGVRIAYDPGDPQDARLAGDRTGRIAALVFSVLGGVLLLVAVGLLVGALAA